MERLPVIWENVYGLLVDDGSIALGTLGALLLVGLWSQLTTSSAFLSELGGPLLFVLLMGLLVANLYRTGQIAAQMLGGEKL
jgi:NhaP-type Na+/H+ or K+/H+ antiporter